MSLPRRNTPQSTLPPPFPPGLTTAECRVRIVAFVRLGALNRRTDDEVFAFMRDELGLSVPQGAGDLRRLVDDGVLLKRDDLTRPRRWGGVGKPAVVYSVPW